MLKEYYEKLGVYISYDEKANGSIQNAINIANIFNCLIWPIKSIILPNRFTFPTTLVIKIKKKRRFFRGRIVDIKRDTDVSIIDLFEAGMYMPKLWIDIGRKNCHRFKTIVYVENLRETFQPSEVKCIRPPQRPCYIYFSGLDY